MIWNVVTPCGTTLGAVYDSTAPRQTGATTRVEQQDAWVIELNQPLAATNAFFAGWDVSGVAFTGGYSIHHGESLAQQYVEWYGLAASVNYSAADLTVPYVSNFWALANSLGSVGPGASGGPVFDSAHRLVASLSLAALSPVGGQAGVCPMTPLIAPSALLHAALGTSLAAVFDSTDDPSSTTGATTLRALLDPDRTGVQVFDGVVALAPPTFTTTSSYANVSTSVTLTWSAPLASSCLASGGEPGDGWTGTLPPSGSVQVTETFGLIKTYALECVVGTRRQHASVTVNWQGNTPYFQFDQLNLTRTGARWIGAPLKYRWNTNVPPCAVTRGGVLLTTLTDPTGYWTITENAPGTYTYDVACGSGNTAITRSQSAVFEEPSLAFTTESDSARVGELLTLDWESSADVCQPSGGGPGDNWPSNIFYYGSGAFTPIENTPGTYTFSITCLSGALSRSAQATVSFTADAPSAVLNMKIAPTAPGPVVIDWQSNVRSCALSLDGASLGPLFQNFKGEYSGYLNIVGTHKYSLDCVTEDRQASAHAEASVTVTRDPPVVVLTAASTQVQVGDTVILNWDVTNAESCTADGDWSTQQLFSRMHGDSGYLAQTPGMLHFNLTCSASGQSVTASVAVTVNARSATPPPPPTTGTGGSGGSGGGGGRLDILVLIFLALVAAARLMRVRVAP